ncbi:MAG TPA: hypothetical protein VIK86_01290 [Candidatus Paceibacterota bacterium]
MKKSNLSFADGFNPNGQGQINLKLGKPNMAFDWDKAAEIIKENFKLHKDLVAEAGLQGDWAYTGGIIFEDGKPTNDSYTYLSSNWAIPTLILSFDDEEQEEINCSVIKNERFDNDIKWDNISLSILGIQL